MQQAQNHSRRRCQAADQGCGQADARSDAPPVSCAAPPASARSPSSPAATSSTATAPKTCCARCRASTTRCRRCCSAEPSWRRPIRKATSRGRSRSTPITTRTRRRWSIRRPTSSKSPAWSTTRSRGRSTSCTRCREVSQITRHVCVEGWSAIGSWQGARAVGFPQAHRRRHARQIRLVQMRRGLHQHHRHADRAASADADDASSSTTSCCRAPTASR